MPDATTLAAWYGAGIATAVLVWDIIKHVRSGPRIDVDVAPNSMLLGVPGMDAVMVMVTVRNNGTAATTLTGLTLAYFDSGSRSPDLHIAVPQAGVEGERLPHVLEPGRRWLGAFERSSQVVEMARTGRLVVRISTTDRDRPYEARVLIPT